ncbi:uncharacterized protein BT62DRAFT_1012565 [Guyanagaster necrorhizus]|uniref:Uncharacterized protein n=1 Tax=Guyanagaster necrorhizus TaxID=856835 RepID=A0A9P8AM89_9AGAR|nr:uncharacterized protein BT62DRAFT_1012565 [Guyanagaster necrorhizus MCA 3950]KAG7440630.1 hypothetical protein BT62DRAFT_1012565 [Guyanagaster necrorhizus MCA 3950]
MPAPEDLAFLAALRNLLSAIEALLIAYTHKPSAIFSSPLRGRRHLAFLTTYVFGLCLGRMNDWLAKRLGTGQISTLVGEKFDTSGTSEVQVAYPSAILSDIRTVAICAGLGGSMLVGRDADVYFTGEMSHHEVFTLVSAGKHVILCE